MNIGKSVKILLAQQEMNQTELAVKVGVSRAVMSYVCNHPSCSPGMMVKLCEVFDLKASELIALGE